MRVGLAFACALFSATPVFADPDRDEAHGREHYDPYFAPGHRGGEYVEEYRDGDCKVERKWERDGSYEEEWKCEGPRSEGEWGERKEEYWDGPCRVERKWSRDGYRVERKCFGR